MATPTPTDDPPPLPPEIGSAALKREILIRPVWSSNLEHEFSLIRNLICQFPFVSMDTEFPGVIFRQPQHNSDPIDLYQTLKSNVDALKLIQVGITLSDSSGNLPDLGSPENNYIWEFNFSDFDVARDDHAPNSIDLLRNQGIDFEYTRQNGVSASLFAELLMSSGLLCCEDVTYITFHSGYDFGYLIKVLTGKALPDTLPEFLNLLKIFFGKRVYDVKHLMKYGVGLHGGLERLAKSLGVERVAGKCHQAGSDSLLTWHTFEKMTAVHFRNVNKEDYAGVLYGLEIPDP